MCHVRARLPERATIVYVSLRSRCSTGSSVALLWQKKLKGTRTWGLMILCCSSRPMRVCASRARGGGMWQQGLRWWRTNQVCLFHDAPSWSVDPKARSPCSANGGVPLDGFERRRPGQSRRRGGRDDDAAHHDAEGARLRPQGAAARLRLWQRLPGAADSVVRGASESRQARRREQRRRRRRLRPCRREEEEEQDEGRKEREKQEVKEVQASSAIRVVLDGHNINHRCRRVPSPRPRETRTPRARATCVETMHRAPSFM